MSDPRFQMKEVDAPVIAPHEAWPGAQRVGEAIIKQELKETMDLAAQGRIQPIADKIYSMEDVEQAFEALRKGRVLGRDVVAI